MMSIRKKWILFSIYVLLGVGGVLTLVLARDYLSLNFVADECKTFGLTMLAWLKWLIIPAALLAASFLTLIPTLFKMPKFSKALIFVEFLALAGVAFWLTFFVNANWTGGTLSKIFNTIGYIINYAWIIAWIVLIVLFPLMIVNDLKEYAVMSAGSIAFSAFLMACSGHISVIGQGKFWWGLLNLLVGGMALVLPIIMAVTLYKSRNEISTDKISERYLHIVGEHGTGIYVGKDFNPITGEVLLDAKSFTELMQQLFNDTGIGQLEIVRCEDHSDEKDYHFDLYYVDHEDGETDDKLPVYKLDCDFSKSKKLKKITDDFAKLATKHINKN